MCKRNKKWQKIGLFFTKAFVMKMGEGGKIIAWRHLWTNPQCFTKLHRVILIHNIYFVVKVAFFINFGSLLIIFEVCNIFYVGFFITFLISFCHTRLSEYISPKLLVCDAIVVYPIELNLIDKWIRKKHIKDSCNGLYLLSGFVLGLYTIKKVLPRVL